LYSKIWYNTAIYPMRKLLMVVLVVLALAVLAVPGLSWAAKFIPTPTPTATPTPTLTPVPAPDITQRTPQTLGPLEALLAKQKLGKVWPANPLKYAIRSAVGAGVPANTIVLLLLLPIVALVIAVTRNIVGIRGFGIFLPASLSVVFVAIGPFLGIGLFLLIVAISTAVRIILRKFKIKLLYLPRMALIFWAVVIGVLGILFLAPVIKWQSLTNVSIFAVLILILLAEDFIRVQLGKSVKTAVSLTSETLIIALVSYAFMTFKPLQNYVLLNPEISLVSVGILDFLLAKYSGLRLMEIWRFRKLISNN
jgi:hypothetical protein